MILKYLKNIADFQNLAEFDVFSLRKQYNMNSYKSYSTSQDIKMNNQINSAKSALSVIKGNPGVKRTYESTQGETLAKFSSKADYYHYLKYHRQVSTIYLKI